jgi:hypothetical protein
MSKTIINKIPGYVNASLYIRSSTQYGTIQTDVSSTQFIIPARLGPCCQDCYGPCDDCHQCYVDYVYTGLEDPSYCYNGFECKSCYRCERTCQPCPF